MGDNINSFSTLIQPMVNYCRKFEDVDFNIFSRYNIVKLVHFLDTRYIDYCRTLSSKYLKEPNITRWMSSYCWLPLFFCGCWSSFSLAVAWSSKKDAEKLNYVKLVNQTLATCNEVPYISRRCMSWILIWLIWGH